MSANAITPHWHILGAGAMGCLWAASLASSGQQVTLLLRDRQALADFPGMVCVEREGQVYRYPVEARCPDGATFTIDHLLIAVKAHDTLSAIQPWRSCLGRHSIIVLMQNGMGVPDELMGSGVAGQIIVAATTDGAYRRAPYRTVHAGRGQTWLGSWSGDLDVAVVCGLLGGGFLRVQKDDDIKTRLWHKLAINCAINPLTALLGCRNGELLDLPGERRVLRIICEEAAQVMAAEGIIGDAEELYARVCIIIEATADNYSSMLQDLRAGRSTEIDYLNGYLLRQGAAHGIPLPCNTLLLDMIRLRQRMSQPF